MEQEAVDKFGQEFPEIWEEYGQFEAQRGNLKRANAVRWRVEQRRQGIQATAVRVNMPKKPRRR